MNMYLACMPVWAQASLVNSMQRPSFTSHKHISLKQGQTQKVEAVCHPFQLIVFQGFYYIVTDKQKLQNKK